MNFGDLTADVNNNEGIDIAYFEVLFEEGSDTTACGNNVGGFADEVDIEIGDQAGPIGTDGNIMCDLTQLDPGNVVSSAICDEPCSGSNYVASSCAA